MCQHEHWSLRRSFGLMSLIIREVLNVDNLNKCYHCWPLYWKYHFYPVCMRKGVKWSVLSSSARKSPDPEFWANLRVLLVVKVSEIERKRAYVRQGCPKGTTKAINSAFCLVTPISHTHSNYLHMHAPYFERSRKRTSTLAINRMMAT